MKMDDNALAGLGRFLRESLFIEGIMREPTQLEIDATLQFLSGDLNASRVIALQAVYAPGHPLRSEFGMNVRVGQYVPPWGFPGMEGELRRLLAASCDPYKVHVDFELLHPFMDGNGRTGRAVWLHLMLARGADPFALGFLHRFYYQTLEAQGRPHD